MQQGRTTPWLCCALSHAESEIKKTPLAVACHPPRGAAAGPDKGILPVGSVGEADGLRMTVEAVPWGPGVRQPSAAAGRQASHWGW